MAKTTHRTTLAQRAWPKVERRGPDECWPWIRRLTADGYGIVTERRDDGHHTTTLAHRRVWRVANGPVPEGLTVDHTCHNRDLTCRGGKTCLHRRCCNPAHLEAVPLPENIKRAQRETCRYGHPLDGIFPADKWRKQPTRYCKTCYYARQRASRASRRARGLRA